MKKLFLTGLALLLPLAVTIAIIRFIVNFLTKPFIGVVSAGLAHFHIVNRGFLFLSPEQISRVLSQILILLLLFLVTVGIGIVTRWIFIRYFVHLWDRLIHKIPIVNTIYKTTQDVIQTLFTSDKKSFQKVVLVPFPKKDVYVMGLVVREAPSSCSAPVGKPLISVFVPTTPNPTTGFLLMYEEEALIYTAIKPEDALKYIISCGVIIPEAATPPP